MSSEPQSPTFRGMLLGVVLIIIATLLLCSLSDVLKTVGSPFLFIPSVLGLVRTVGQEDVRTIEMANSPTAVRLPQPGRYAVYVDDIDMLSITDSLINSRGNPWLKVKAQATGETIPTTLIERGLRLYDTPLAKGRPVINFTIAQPGVYELTHPRRKINMRIVPDYTTGHETLLAVIYLVQIVLIVGLALFFWRRRNREERETAKAQQDAWIKRANAYWEKRAAQQRAEQEKRDSK